MRIPVTQITTSRRSAVLVSSRLQCLQQCPQVRSPLSSSWLSVLPEGMGVDCDLWEFSRNWFSFERTFTLSELQNRAQIRSLFYQQQGSRAAYALHPKAVAGVWRSLWFTQPFQLDFTFIFVYSNVHAVRELGAALRSGTATRSPLSAPLPLPTPGEGGTLSARSWAFRPKFNEVRLLEITNEKLNTIRSSLFLTLASVLMLGLL